LKRKLVILVVIEVFLRYIAGLWKGKKTGQNIKKQSIGLF